MINEKDNLIEVDLSKIKTLTQSSNELDAMRVMAHNLKYSVGIDEEPIPLKPIIDYLGIDYKWSHFNSTDLRGEACLKLENGRFQILVNGRKNYNWRRARFSVAHEIGHYIFLMYTGGSTTQLMQQNESNYKLLESMCDAFAQELLIPRKSVDSQLKDIAAIGFSGMANKYKVSRSAIIRSIIDGKNGLSWVILSSEDNKRAEDEMLRVKYSYPPYKKIPNADWFPKGISINRFITTGDVVKIKDYSYNEAIIDLGNRSISRKITRISDVSENQMYSMGKYLNIIISKSGEKMDWML